MTDGTAQGWNRRDFVGGAALLALAIGVPVAAVRLSLPDTAPSEPQMALIRDVAQLVIPRTATPGAGEAGVGAFVALALAHGLEDTAHGDPRGIGYLRWLEQTLGRRANGDFLGLPPEQRAAVLAALDAEAFPDGLPPEQPSPWRKLKALILNGYYTSEIGAAQELRYELVPGKWQADLPLKPGDKAWSSDWTAVEFG